MPELTTEYVDIADLVPHPRNIRHGDVGAIAESLEYHGQYRTIVVSEATMHVLAGNHTFLAMRHLGHERVAVHLLPGLSEEDELRIMLADNATSDKATNDDAALTELLLELAQSSTALAGTGFDRDELDALMSELDRSRLDPKGATERLRGNKMLSEIDLIFTMGSYGKGSEPTIGLDDSENDTWGHIVQVLCCLAVKSGWQYGVQSSKLTCGAARIWDTHRPVFIDNEFKDYDHAAHLRYVNYWTPKYATTRDLMTRDQCAEIDVPYHSVKQTLKLAEEVKAAGAQRVILIPKYDCIGRLPEEYVMGFSVPTSYGGTPLPVEAFAGRDVHLLGGSPAIQIAYVEAFTEAGANVISLDNNYMLKVAKWGTFWTTERAAGHLDEIGFPVGSLSNPLYISLGISLGAFARYFQRQASDEDIEILTREGIDDAEA